MPEQALRFVLYPPFSREAGRREVAVSCGPGQTLAGALRELADAEPALGGRLAPEGLDRVFLAVAGGRLLRADSPLTAGEPVLLVPPMSGG